MSEPISENRIDEIVRRVVRALGREGGVPASGSAERQAGARPTGRITPAVLTRTLGVAVSRPDAKVEAALAGAARAGVQMVGFADSDCPIANTRAMCAAVVAGEVAGGVAIDRYAAAPMILTAKFAGIRPVQGVSLQAVLAALRQFDANVLVIGHTTVSLYEIRSMIDRFSAGRRMGRDRTPLLDAVDELEAS